MVGTAAAIRIDAEEAFMKKFLLFLGLFAFVGGTAVTTTGCSKEQRASA